MYSRIIQALDALDLLQYKDKFVVNELDDSLVEECISDGSLETVLKDVIPILGHRLKFKKKFSGFNSISGDNATVVIPSNNGQGCSGEPADDSEWKYADQEFTHPDEPQPVQIMDFRRKGKADGPVKIWCHETALASILKRTENRPVAVLAIAGPTRKGKSVFLNFVLRRLVGLQNDEIDWMGWARKTEALTGFSWEASDERVTAGIWMWSEPFTLKSKKDGTEFDILLMDTQGVFDERSGPREWSILMGLSLLTSSCLLFNIVNNIEEKDLLLLDEFLSFGLMALEDQNVVGTDSQSAFQKLVFLIRDWNNPGNFPYGSQGGKNFIQKKLEIKDYHQESHKAVREKLKKCFEEISCFLLPHPGLDAIQLNFNGSIAACAQFANEVEKSIVELLDKQDFPIKNIRGNSLTGQDLLDLFKLYVNLFNAEQLSSEAIYNVASQGCNSAVINKCISFFISEIEKRLKGVPFVSDNSLDKYVEAAHENALKLFSNSRKMGSETVINQAHNDLCEKLAYTSEERKSQNSKMRVEAVSRAHDDAVLKYSKLVEETLANAGEFAEESYLEQSSESAENRALQLFNSLLQLTDPNALVDEKDLVRQSIQDKFEQYLQSNQARRSEAEKLLNDDISVLIDNYNFGMDSKINGQIISDEELESIHSNVSRNLLDNFANSHSSSLLYEQGRESLVQQISSVHDNLQKLVSAAYENAVKEGEALIDNALASYRDKMENDIGIDEEDFAKSHSVYKASSLQILRSAGNISSTKIMDKFVNLLESKIHDVHIELLVLLHQKKTRVENEIVKAKEVARKSFEEAIQAFFNQKPGPIPELKLEARYNHEKSQALNSLKEFYEGMEAVLKNAEEQHIADSDELTEVMQNIFIKFQDTNKLRWQAFEFQAQNYLSQAKTEYTRKLKIVADNTFDEEELQRKNAALSDEAEKLLLENVDPGVAKSEFLKKLLDDFKSYVEAHFDEILEVFQLRLEEDEVAVQAALYEAKRYYNEEMDKRVKRKDWFESDELSVLNDELTAAAVHKCKEDVVLTDNQEKQLRDAMKVVYLKYFEENQRRYPAENLAIGIDLGTTYSCVAVYMNGNVKIIPNREVGESSTTTPSYVAFNKDRTIDVGEAAKLQAYRNPLNTIFDAKRLIGRAYSDNVVQQDIKLWPFDVISDDGKPQIRVCGKNYRPEEISAKVVVKMKQIAETYLGKPVKQAVVTVPAYFSDGQRQATRDAAEIAGLKVRILNEPTAAAIAYKLHRTDELKRNVLIYDLGGGTFDVAVLEMKGGEIKVKATGGDTHLGGEDFDNNMVNSIIGKVKSNHGVDLARGRNSVNPNEKQRASERLRRIRDRCEAAKRILSSSTSTVVAIDNIDEDLDLNETFTRHEFEQLNMAQFKRSIEIVKHALEDAKLDKADVDDIVLVGGSTRIPKVQELLKAFFDGRKELNCTINADEAVACGAAIQAALLNGEQANSLTRGMVLIDVAPLSLGIEIVTGEMSKVIHKNSAVPCNHTEVFRTVVNNQTTVNFKVYEGEDPIAVNNNFLGKFLLTGIPSAPAGREPLDCTMTIDAEGILHVKAVSRNNGKASDIKIETYNGRMTDEEITEAQLQKHFHW